MRRILLQNDRVWMWMSLGAIVVIALLVLANMMLAHRLGEEREKSFQFRNKYEESEFQLRDVHSTLRELEKLLVVKERLIENLRRVDEVRKQP